MPYTPLTSIQERQIKAFLEGPLKTPLKDGIDPREFPREFDVHCYTQREIDGPLFSYWDQPIAPGDCYFRMGHFSISVLAAQNFNHDPKGIFGRPVRQSLVNLHSLLIPFYEYEEHIRMLERIIHSIDPSVLCEWGKIEYLDAGPTVVDFDLRPPHQYDLAISPALADQAPPQNWRLRQMADGKSFRKIFYDSDEHASLLRGEAPGNHILKPIFTQTATRCDCLELIIGDEYVSRLLCFRKRERRGPRWIVLEDDMAKI